MSFHLFLKIETGWHHSKRVSKHGALLNPVELFVLTYFNVPSLLFATEPIGPHPNGYRILPK